MIVGRHSDASVPVACSAIDARVKPLTRLRRLCSVIGAIIGLLRAVPAQADATAIELQARGAQIYVCEQSSDVYAWRLKGPEAILLNASGSEAGRHFSGPSWQAKDGSIVVGEPIIASGSPTEGSVPWVILRAKSHAHSGIFSSVDYVVRVHTQGGLAPADGCDRSHRSDERSVGYTATYVFFSH